MRKALFRRFALVVVPLTVMLLATSAASAAVWDRNDTAGHLDIRWLNLKELPRERLRLTISFWSGFRAEALAGSYQRGLLVRYRRPWLSEFNALGFTVRKDGQLKFRSGDLGSSLCCWGSPLTRIGPHTVTTTFIPWWIRTGGEHIDGIHYSARTRLCGDRCLIDFTRKDLVR
jgi:hypothetical protein